MTFGTWETKIWKEVEDVKISLWTKNLWASSDNLSVVTTGSGIKDFNSNNGFKYTINMIPEVISKSNQHP